jgi:drug/metabolite transporter (DMT)-like permease
MAVVVGAGCAWPYFIQPWVINRNGSAFMALMVSFLPLLTILISIPVLGVRPSTRQAVGVIGSLVCLGLLLGDGLERHVPLLDIAMALSVPFGYAIANTVIRRWLPHMTPLLLTFLTFLVSAVILTPAACLVAAPQQSDDWVSALAALLFLGVVGTGLATLLFNKLIREHGPLFAGMTTNLVPVGAVLIAWLDAEQISVWQGVSLIGILVMVALVQYRAATPIKRIDAARSEDAANVVKESLGDA